MVKLGVDKDGRLIRKDMFHIYMKPIVVLTLVMLVIFTVEPKSDAFINLSSILIGIALIESWVIFNYEMN